jgi:hypothetical protein
MSGFTACSSPLDLTGLVEGTHLFEVRSRDAAGNLDPVPATYSWNVDLTPPETTIDSGPPAESRSSSATFDLSSNEAGVSYECQLNMDPALPCSDPHSLTGLTDGPYTLRVQARDLAGNLDPTPATYSWNVDRTVPAPPMISFPGNNTFTDNPTVTVVGTTEASLRVRVFLNGSSIDTVDAEADGDWSLPLGTLADGLYTLQAQAEDAAGNVSQVSATTTFTVDTVDPAPPVIQTPQTPTNNPRPTISGTTETSPHQTMVQVFVDGAMTGLPAVVTGSTWTFTPPANLDDGTHTFVARAIDPAMNTSPDSNTVSIVVDRMAPAAPTITMPRIFPPPGVEVYATREPTFSGTAEAGATVQVFVDMGMTPVGTVMAMGGVWSYTLTPLQALGQGGHNVIAIAADAAGNPSAQAGPVNFVVDTVAPPPPEVTSPAAGSRTNDQTPTIAGTAEGNARVTVIVGTTEVAAVDADGSGVWSYTLRDDQALPEGSHDVRARAADAAGNVGLTSVPKTFTVDLTPPAPPSIERPPSPTSTNDITPSLSGTAEPLSRVEVFVDGGSDPAGFADADGAGNWTLTIGPLPLGAHTVTARARDLAGNVSQPSPETTILIDDLGPASPEILTPEDGAAVGTRTPTVTGKAEAGATIRIFDTTAGQVTFLGTAVADGALNPDGTRGWTFTAPQLSEGGHDLTATASDAAGNTSPPSPPVEITVDVTAPAPPVILAPENGSSTTLVRPQVTGTAEIGAEVRVSVDGVSIGMDTAGPGGVWSVPPQSSLPAGMRTVTAVAVDRAGNQSSPPATVTFTILAREPGTVRIDSPTNGAQLNDQTPTLLGVADADVRVEIFVNNGATPVGETAADGSGSWTFTFGSDLSEGTYVLTARSVQDGTPGPISEAVTITIDVTPPAPPTLDEPSNNSATSDPTPLFKGTTTVPGETVEVFVDGTLRGTVVSDVSGEWILALTGAPLTSGPHTASAQVRDEAGNVSVGNPSVTFTVDLTGPNAPIVEAPMNGAVVNVSRPGISGTVESGAAVTVTLNGQAQPPVFEQNGMWSLTPALPLPDDVYIVRAVATDAAGNVSPSSAPVVFTVDTSAAGAPRILAPAEGAFVPTAQPQIRGTAEPLTTVRVYLQEQLVGTANASAAGDWSFVPPMPLADGLYGATAEAVDAGGNVSQLSPVRRFTVDTVDPAPPIITAPTQGAVIGDARPTITGTAEGDSRVTVIVDGETVAEVVADSSGNWTYRLTAGQALRDESHDVTAIAHDAAGNASLPAATVTFLVDTEAPPRPQILEPVDGHRTRDPRPAVSGTATPGTTVEILFNGQLLGSAPADADGAWTLLPPMELADGTYVITARSVDTSGNRSAPSLPVSVTIDRTAPAAPVVSAPADQSRSSNPAPTILGTAEPGARVAVFIDGQQLTDTGVADGTGAWRLPITQVLVDGTHRVSARATDAVGNEGPLSAENVFLIDTVVPAPPEIRTPQSGARLADPTPEITGTAEPGARVLVLIDGLQVGSVLAAQDGSWSYTLTAGQALPDGSHRATARAVDSVGNFSALSSSVSFEIDTRAPARPEILQPQSGSATSDVMPTISGRAEPGAVVQIHVNGDLYGSVTADLGGTWTFEGAALLEGTYEITAVARDDAGNESEPSVAVTVTIDTTPPGVPVVLEPAQGSQVRDPTPEVTGTSEPNASIDVYIDGRLVGTAIADGEGRWSLTVTSPLSQGEHTVAALARDRAGNAGMLSAANRFLVDSVAPPAPTVTGPPSPTNDPTPRASGTAEPGTRVDVYVDGQLVGTATAGQDGSWSIELPTLPEGTHAVSAVAVDPAGNESAPGARVVTVDTTPPAPPVILEPVHGRVYLELPVPRGTAPSEIRVRLFLDGVEIGEIRSTAAGEWSLAFPAALHIALGEHLLSAVAIDDAGNVSPPSNEVRFFFGLGGSGENVIRVTGGSCACDAASGSPGLGAPWLLAAGLLLLLRRRRRTPETDNLA